MKLNCTWWICEAVKPNHAFFYSGAAKFGTFFNLYGPMVIVNNTISNDKKIHFDENCIRTFV